VLKPGDLLTAIRIPATWAGAQFHFEKIRDRQVWDFPLFERCICHGGQWRQYRAYPHRGECSGSTSAPPHRGGGRRSRQTAEYCDRRNGRKAKRWKVPSLCATTDMKIPLMRNLVEARHQRRRGGQVGIIEFATSPWGEKCPDPRCLLPHVGCRYRRLGLPDRPRYLGEVLRKATGPRGNL